MLIFLGRNIYAYLHVLLNSNLFAFWVILYIFSVVITVLINFYCYILYLFIDKKKIKIIKNYFKAVLIFYFARLINEYSSSFQDLKKVLIQLLNFFNKFLNFFNKFLSKFFNSKESNTSSNTNSNSSNTNKGGRNEVNSNTTNKLIKRVKKKFRRRRNRLNRETFKLENPMDDLIENPMDDLKNDPNSFLNKPFGVAYIKDPFKLTSYFIGYFVNIDDYPYFNTYNGNNTRYNELEKNIEKYFIVTDNQLCKLRELIIKDLIEEINIRKEAYKQSLSNVKDDSVKPNLKKDVTPNKERIQIIEEINTSLIKLNLHNNLIDLNDNRYIIKTDEYGFNYNCILSNLKDKYMGKNGYLELEKDSEYELRRYLRKEIGDLIRHEFDSGGRRFRKIIWKWNNLMNYGDIDETLQREESDWFLRCAYLERYLFEIGLWYTNNQEVLKKELLDETADLLIDQARSIKNKN